MQTSPHHSDRAPVPPADQRDLALALRYIHTDIKRRQNYISMDVKVRNDGGIAIIQSLCSLLLVIRASNSVSLLTIVSNPDVINEAV